jgi:hypothetical protein
MPVIQGTFRDSTSQLITSGVLTVELGAPIADRSVVPNAVHFPIARRYQIVNGVSTQPIDVLTTQEKLITYRLTLETIDIIYEYFKPGGEPYGGTVHQWNDGNWWTDTMHTAQSVLLSRQAIERRNLIDSFNALIPDLPTVQYADLIPVPVSRSTLPTTLRQLANLLVSEQDYRQIIQGILNWRGDYVAGAAYQFGDLVRSGGTVWFYSGVRPTVTEAPYFGSSVWEAWGLKGDPGGTGGDSTAFGVNWANDPNAPSKGTIYNEFLNNRATKAQVEAKANKDSPGLTGTPTAPTQAAGTGGGGTAIAKESIATCEYTDRAVGAMIQLEVGVILDTGTANPPARTLRANGAAVNRTTYATLFARYGTTFGAGDGTNTFNLPNVPSRVTGTYALVVTGV